MLFTYRLTESMTESSHAASNKPRSQRSQSLSSVISREIFERWSYGYCTHRRNVDISIFFLQSSSCAYFDRPHSPTTDKYCTVRCLLSLSLSVHVRSPVGPLSLYICSMGGAVRSTACSA